MGAACSWLCVQPAPKEAHTAAGGLQRAAACTAPHQSWFPWCALLTSGAVSHGLWTFCPCMPSDPVLTAWAAPLQALSRLRSARRQSMCMVTS